MGTRLRRLKAQLKGQILSDGKCLSGKNRLTEHEIDNLQSYYGSAIRRNHSSVQNMRQAIWAIFLHKLSTDEYPQHGFCPIGEDSWCGFKKAEASGKSYKHKNSLLVAVVEAMRPIFRDLSHPDLLKNVCMEKHKTRMKVFILSFGHVFPKQHLYRLKHFHLVFMMLFVPLMMGRFKLISGPGRRFTGPLGAGGSKFITRRSGQVQFIRVFSGSSGALGTRPKRLVDKPTMIPHKN
ncbi:uncharacterized protein TNCV_4473541 [Trichonephila clavipes]|nr:uncharacterized protein TNCV_4473541 [Trichonephila clavipes]